MFSARVTQLCLHCWSEKSSVNDLEYSTWSPDKAWVISKLSLSLVNPINIGQSDCSELFSED